MSWNQGSSLAKVIPLQTNATPFDCPGNSGVANMNGGQPVAVPDFADGYEISIVPKTPGAFWCDVSVQQWTGTNPLTDKIVSTDRFSVGNWTGTSSSGIVIRGKLVAPAISVGVITAANAAMSTVAVGLATSTDVTVFVSVLPSYPTATARISPIGAPGLGLGFVGDLMSFTSTAVAASGSNTILNQGVALLPYVGDVFLGVYSQTNNVSASFIVCNFYNASNGGAAQRTIAYGPLQGQAIGGAAATPLNTILKFPAMPCRVFWEPMTTGIAGTVFHSAFGVYD